MRIMQSGRVVTPVPARPDAVLAVLSDQAEVVTFVEALVDGRSTPTRWIVEPVRVGPVVVRPVTDVTHRVDGDRVVLRGVPVPDATPTWIEVRMAVGPGGPGTRVVTHWRVRVDLPGPQFVARLARPLLRDQTQWVSAELSRRLVERFDPAPDGDAARDAGTA